MFQNTIRLALGTALFMIFSGLSLQAWAQNDPQVVGYQAWKNSRIEEAKSALEKVTGEKSSPKASDKDKKFEASATPGSSGSVSRLQSIQKSGRPDQKIQQAQLNLELAQELSVNDYFVLYLSQFKGREAFVEAAKRLSTDETAELMMAYQRHLRSGEQRDVGPSSASLSPSILSR